MGERRRRRRRRRRRDEEEEQRQLQLRQWYFDKLKRGLVMTVPELKAQEKVLGIHRTRLATSTLLGEDARRFSPPPSPDRAKSRAS